MKKNYVIIALITLLLALISPGNAMAATGISEAEQSILDKLKSGAKIDGVMSYLPVAYVNQAENELMGNSVDLTKEQAEIVIRKIDEAIEIMSRMGTVDLEDLASSDSAFKLLTVATEAANAAGYEVSLDLVNSSIDVRNSEGGSIFLAKNIVNKTGYQDYSLVITFGISLAVIIIALVIFTLYRCKDDGLYYEA